MSGCPAGGAGVGLGSAGRAGRRIHRRMVEKVTFSERFVPPAASGGDPDREEGNRR